MAMNLDATATIPVRIVVKTAGTPVSNSNPVEKTVKDVLVAAFAAIPNQAGGTATVGAIVTALQTLP